MTKEEEKWTDKTMVEKIKDWIMKNHNNYYESDYDEDFGEGICFNLSKFVNDLCEAIK